MGISVTLSFCTMAAIEDEKRAEKAILSPMPIVETSEEEIKKGSQ